MFIAEVNRYYDPVLALLAYSDSTCQAIDIFAHMCDSWGWMHLKRADRVTLLDRNGKVVQIFLLTNTFHLLCMPYFPNLDSFTDFHILIKLTTYQIRK